MNKIKSIKGITLISLVVTIIILLILAGVTISMLTGENGIITQAVKAKNMTEKSELEEQMALYKMEIEMGTEKTLKDLLIRDGLVDSEEIEKNGIATISNDILVVSNFEGLKEISKNVAEGKDYNGKIIYVINDIDCGATFDSSTGELFSGENFIPIGDYNTAVFNEDSAIIKKFDGVFDGFNYTIEGLYINENEVTDFGTALFGYIGENGEIRDLKLANSYICGYYETGAFVGRNYGKITNCTNESTIIGNRLTGGIAGRNVNLIENCINNGNITGEEQVAGIVANCDQRK